MATMEDKKQAIDMIEKRDGVCTPEALVEYAQPEESPIHDCFEWDDSEAAEMYRIWQARQTIKVVVTTYGDRQTQAYRNVTVSVKVKGDGQVVKRGYVSISRIFNDKNLHNQVLADAIQRIRHWQTEYNQLKELEKVINEDELIAIEKTIKK